MKIRARKQFLLCFRPVVMDEKLTSDGQPGSGDQVFTYFAVADKGDFMIPSHRPRKGARRIFSAMVNTIFSGSKVRQDPYSLNCSQSGKREKLLDFDDLYTDSSVSSSSSSSSSSTSISSSSSDLCQKQSNRSVGEIDCSSSLQESRQETKKKKTVGFGRYSSSYGLLLLLISFSMVILWGRLCAILFTSTLFYLFPRLDIKTHLPEDVGKLDRLDVDSKYYKKSVILGGLLKRNHHV
ncbi:hypothetical protein NE237_032133 [Protea cynaroides]|uniref:Uncharacterized protein n=1 Tax=Protea cynaroides TaxID=273540 RepID=A0A9Q0L2Z4_9MAGN|nr:hypothetical protein NE237_032133 [Protea cynaroides]